MHLWSSTLAFRVRGVAKCLIRARTLRAAADMKALGTQRLAIVILCLVRLGSARTRLVDNTGLVASTFHSPMKSLPHAITRTS